MKKNNIIILLTAAIFFCIGISTLTLIFNNYKKSQKDSNVNVKNTINKDKKTEKLKKDKICIDPGHQEKGDFKTEEIAPGSSQRKPRVMGGATGIATKKPEYKLTLEIGLKLRDALKNQGYEVFMIREKNDVNISNKERALMTNKEGCDVYLRLHADAGGSSTRGATVLTSSSKNPYTKSVQQSSDKFSKAILSEYTKATGFKSRGVSYRDDLTGTNWSTVTNTLLEMGFMTNPEEDRKMASPDFQNVMVKGIVNGIDKYFRER